MQQVPENFGDCIRRLRRCLFLSQKDLARLLGVSYVSLNRWENGCYAPSPLALQRLDDFCEKASTLQPEPGLVALARWVKNYRQTGIARGRRGRMNGTPSESGAVSSESGAVSVDSLSKH